VYLVKRESVELLNKSIVKKCLVVHHVGLHKGEFMRAFEVVLVDVMIDDLLID
jgi:hypothetical protein